MTDCNRLVCKSDDCIFTISQRHLFTRLSGHWWCSGCYANCGGNQGDHWHFSLSSLSLGMFITLEKTFHRSTCTRDTSRSSFQFSFWFFCSSFLTFIDSGIWLRVQVSHSHSCVVNSVLFWKIKSLAQGQPARTEPSTMRTQSPVWPASRRLNSNE